MIPNGPWFRMWCVVVDNPKLQTLPAELFRVWVNLCCLAKTHEGILPDADTIAFRLRKPRPAIDKILGMLADNRLVDQLPDGTLEMHEWDAWQHPVDRSTERTKRWRGKRKATVTRDGSGDGKCDGNSSTVTRPEQNRTETEQNRNRETAFSSPSYTTDECYMDLLAAWDEWGPPTIPEERVEGRGVFNAYAPDQRLEIIARVRAHIEAASDPAFHRLLKFLRSEWRRPIVKPKPRGSDTAARALKLLGDD